MARFDNDELDDLCEELIDCGRKYGIRKLLEVVSEALEEFSVVQK